MLKLDRRDGKIGTSINTRGEMHGDETIPAKDIPFTLMISRQELATLLREPLAGESLFNERAGFAEPLFGGKISPIKLIGKFENSTIVVTVGIDETEIQLENVTLASLSVDPQAGGMTLLKLQAQYHPQDSDNVALLEKWLNHECKLQIDIGKLAKPKKDDQQQLPLGDPSDGDDGDLTVYQDADSLASALEQDDEDQKAAELLAQQKPKSRRKARRAEH